MAVLCRLKGSVIPKALVWSVPCAMLILGCGNKKTFPDPFCIFWISVEWLSIKTWLTHMIMGHVATIDRNLMSVRSFVITGVIICPPQLHGSEWKETCPWERRFPPRESQPVQCLMLRTIGLHMFFRDAMVEAMGGGGSEGIDTIWSGYNFILGFLIVFRSTVADSLF